MQAPEAPRAAHPRNACAVARLSHKPRRPKFLVEIEQTPTGGPSQISPAKRSKALRSPHTTPVSNTPTRDCVRRTTPVVCATASRGCDSVDDRPAAGGGITRATNAIGRWGCGIPRLAGNSVVWSKTSGVYGWSLCSLRMRLSCWPMRGGAPTQRQPMTCSATYSWSRGAAWSRFRRTRCRGSWLARGIFSLTLSAASVGALRSSSVSEPASRA